MYGGASFREERLTLAELGKMEVLNINDDDDDDRLGLAEKQRDLLYQVVEHHRKLLPRSATKKQLVQICE